MASRRSYGTGSLYVRKDSTGRETWYGKWHSNGRRVKRAIGPKRVDGSRDGLTRAQAEAELRRLMAETQPKPLVGERLDVEEVAPGIGCTLSGSAASAQRWRTSRARSAFTWDRSSLAGRSTRSPRRT